MPVEHLDPEVEAMARDALIAGSPLDRLVGSLEAELQAAQEREKALREALEVTFEAFAVADQGDPWYCEHEGIDTGPIYEKARSALAGSPSEKPDA